jgi:hypothetical protein
MKNEKFGPKCPTVTVAHCQVVFAKKGCHRKILHNIHQLSIEFAETDKCQFTFKLVYMILSTNLGALHPGAEAGHIDPSITVHPSYLLRTLIMVSTS